MILTATVVKVGVVSSDKDIFQVTLNLKVNDGTSDIIDQDFTHRYSKGNNLDTIEVVQERFRVDMQKVIDFYKEANQISVSAALSTAITNLELSLVK